MPSFNSLQPDQVAHGTDITIQAQMANGAFVVLGEAYELDYDIDDGIIPLPVLGSRRTGYRQGRIKVAGTIKVYWINMAVTAMLSGQAPTQSGYTSLIYHSARPFQRYNIQVVSPLTLSPAITIMNVVFEKDAATWGEAKLGEQTITFTAEDVLGN